MESDNDFFRFMQLPRELVTDNRPLRLRLDLPGGFNDDMLLPQRVSGSESVCGGIEYRILCVCADAQLPLKKMIAVAAELQFVTDSGDLRKVCGIITEASSGDSDGGLASYQLVLRDALAILEKRTNTRVFRNMDEVEIVQRILNEWRHKNPVLGLCFKHEKDDHFDMQTYPRREFTMQHNESDAAFIRRLLKRRGIGWYIRAGEMSHTLMLFNRADCLSQNAAGTIRYHRDAATEERDTITSWIAVRSLQPATVTRHSWDYMKPQARDFMLVYTSSSSNQGVNGNEMAATLDDYQILPPHAGDDNEDLFILGQLRMKRHDYESKCFHGEGSVRDLCAGEYFTLAEHPEVDGHPDEERDFVVTDLQVTAQNNLPKALAARVEGLFARSRWMHGAADLQLQRDAADKVATGPLRMHIRFTAVRRGVSIVPAFDTRTDVPVAQMQSAIVVGPQGEEVHCDDLGRVKIRFPGTRPEDHEEAAGSGASDTETDSAWVRVASNWAGNETFQDYGAVSLPRIGTEVVITFLGGDPDKPLIIAQVYNQRAQPPGFSKLGRLPANRYLSGIRSREINGDRFNQLRLDDTHGEIGAQLASDHGDSQLNLGYLAEPRVHGAAEQRGDGVELRSDMAVAVRGAAGVLITASPGGGASGKQLERSELNRIIDGLRTLAMQLSKLAENYAAELPHGPALTQLAEKVSELHDVGTQLVAIDGPMGVAVTSGQNLLLGAVSDIDIASSVDTYLSAGGSGAWRVAHDLGLFANQGDVKITAASAKIQMQAQNSAMTLLAKKVMEIMSTTDWIHITAKQGIRINGGGSELVLSADGIKGYTSGKHEMHAADHQTMGGSSKEVAFPGSQLCPTRTADSAQSGGAAVPVAE